MDLSEEMEMSGAGNPVHMVCGSVPVQLQSPLPKNILFLLGYCCHSTQSQTLTTFGWVSNDDSSPGTDYDPDIINVGVEEARVEGEGDPLSGLTNLQESPLKQ